MSYATDPTPFAIYLASLLSSAIEGAGIPGPHHRRTVFGSRRRWPVGSLRSAKYALVRWWVDKSSRLECIWSKVLNGDGGKSKRSGDCGDGGRGLEWKNGSRCQSCLCWCSAWAARGWRISHGRNSRMARWRWSCAWERRLVCQFRSGVQWYLCWHRVRKRRLGFKSLQRHFWLSGTPRVRLPRIRWSWSACCHRDIAFLWIVPDVAPWVSGIQA